MSDLMDALDFYTNDNEIGTVEEISIDLLVPFHNHPFELYQGERLDDMVESIKKNGILTPILVRQLKNNYEILAGHNRVNAAKLAGLTKVPAIVKNKLTDEEAYVYVIETNLMQRSFSDMKISEKALVLNERYNNIKSQGKRNDIIRELKILNGEKVEDEENATVSREDVAQEYGLSGATMARLIRINEVIPEIKTLVDDYKVSILAAVNISYLDKNTQGVVYELMAEDDIKLTEKVSKVIRTAYEKNHNISKANLLKLIEKPKKAEKKKGKSINISTNVYNKYLKNVKKNEIDDILSKALEMYFASENK